MPRPQRYRRLRRHIHSVVPPVPATAVAVVSVALFLVSFSIYCLLSPTATAANDAMLPDPLRRIVPPNGAAALLLKAPVDVKKDAIQADIFLVPSGGGNNNAELWRTTNSSGFHGCSDASPAFAKAEATTAQNRYLMIAASGGLNQQRTGIIDAVVAARILNATLVVPKVDQRSFWKDASDFGDIFDVDWFVSSLKDDVKIIREVSQKDADFTGLPPYRMRVPRKCTPNCYRSRVLPALSKKHVVQLTKFDYRLSNKLEAELQKLRCRVNYHALRFSDPILKMGETLVQRMKQKSSHFVALHLRFEPDMLAFSGCYYGGGEKERAELGAIRRRWKTLHSSNPEKQRRQGRCPLTPEEVGLLLRALGFGNDVHIYVASGEAYGGEETLAPLKALFPNIHSKETLATEHELAPFASFSSRMAALDFIVCDGSDVFVTNNNGNMARMLAGRRRYYGHKRTIRPNARKLNSIFSSRMSMSWEAFASRVHVFQVGFMGEPNEMKPGRGEFYENPTPCICQTGSQNPKDEEIMDWKDLDYGEREHDPLGVGNISNYQLLLS